MARHTLPLLLLVASAAVGALACSDTRIPTSQPVPPPPPPPPPASFAIRPALDTVVVGDWVRFVAESGSSVDQWISSDTSRARLLGHERDWAAVRIRAAGTVTIKATHGADTGQATLVIRPQDTPPAPVTIGNWEAISLGLMDNQAGSAVAISETGTIVGFLRDYLVNQYGGRDQGLVYGFIYKDGVMQKLWSSDTLNRDYLPAAIGGSGKIVGTTSGWYGGRLMVWDSADAAPRFLGDESVSVVGINAEGDFLVNYRDSTSRAVLWRRNETRVDLGSLNNSAGHSSTWATAWNGAGQIVGDSKVSDAPELWHPFIWENGVMRDLGVLGSSNGYATGINAHGVVVGSSIVDTLLRAFIWKDGVLRDLDAFTGQNTRAVAINDQGRVLGVAGYPYNASRYDYYGPGDTVFVWDNGQVDIVTTTRIVGLWLTPSGTVVGSTDVEHESRAFVWEAGVLTDLGPRSWVNGVNSHGEIVGWRGDMPTLWRRKGAAVGN
jgi:probable HAF family extracellular repeat protein